MTNVLLGLVAGLLIVDILQTWLSDRHFDDKILHLEEVVVPWMVSISAHIPGSTPPQPPPPVSG
jgi:hypothetical protein